MKIVEIPSFSPPYGGEFCLEQSRALMAQGHNVTVLACVQLSIKRSFRDYLFCQLGEKTIRMMEVEVYRREIRGIPLCIKPNVKRWVAMVKRMFGDYIKGNGKPDIIHAHCVKWAGYAAYQLSKDYSIPYIITEHLSAMVYKEEFGETGEGCWQVPLLREALQNASMVIPVAEELVDDVSRYFGKDYKWTAISNIIDTDFFHYSERHNETFRFCCLANFIPLKGYDILFKAFKQVIATNPKCELHIAGVDTDSQACKDMIGDIPNIFVHGLLDKEGVRRLLYDSNCLVLASRSEAQPLVLLEAMSTGIPMISTTVVPQYERIDGGCFIVNIDDVEELATAMIRIMNSTQVDGKVLSQKVSELASPKVIGEQLSRLVEVIVNGNS